MALASVYVGRPPVVPVGVLGVASLSGGMGAVSDVARKVAAMQHALQLHEASATPGRDQGPSTVLTVVVAKDNVRGGRLVEPEGMARVRLRASLIKKVQPLAVGSLFDCLRLLLGRRSCGSADGACLADGGRRTLRGAE